MMESNPTLHHDIEESFPSDSSCTLERGMCCNPRERKDMRETKLKIGLHQK
jgi:hypothetical protein